MSNSSAVKVSVIMSVFNNEKTINEALDSILNQTYQDFEFIVCDDASTDNSYEILSYYKLKHPQKIILIRNRTNKKLAYSLNRCLKIAKGKYIVRMDGDDISMPHRLMSQVKFIEEHKEFDLIGSSVKVFDENGVRGEIKQKKIPTKKDILFQNSFNHSTILMTYKAYKKIGFYTDISRTIRCEDYDLWFKFLAANLKGYNFDEPLLKLRVSLKDYKRRTFKSRINEVKTKYHGLKLLNSSFIYLPLVIKPILVGLIPNKIILLIQNQKQMYNE